MQKYTGFHDLELFSKIQSQLELRGWNFYRSMRVKRLRTLILNAIITKVLRERFHKFCMICETFLTDFTICGKHYTENLKTDHSDYIYVAMLNCKSFPLQNFNFLSIRFVKYYYGGSLQWKNDLGLYFSLVLEMKIGICDLVIFCLVYI